jgi:hypothetical protein
MKNRLVGELVETIGTFGTEVAARRLHLLEEIESGPFPGVRALPALTDALCFCRAYPDSAGSAKRIDAVNRRIRRWGEEGDFEADAPILADSGVPASVVRGEFSRPFVERMRRTLPGCFEIDWEELGDDAPLLNGLSLLVTLGECQGLDDIGITLEEWFANCRAEGPESDLDFLLELFAGSALDASTRDGVFDTCGVPRRFELAVEGTARSEILWPPTRTRYQKGDLDRRRKPLGSAIREPFKGDGRVSAAAGERLIDLAQRTLASRGLEIRTLSYANPRDVMLLDCGRGITITLIGVVPRYRDPLESHYCSFVVKNGVPVGYGPSSVSLGCCEIGLNLFPEFRGAEIRFIYPQFLRVLHQALGACYFHLTPYGMGRDNPAAIGTGAFWFYRKMGFRATNDRVEELARAEEARMRADPHYRSSPAMLRRLSDTSAYFDLSDGKCFPLDFGAIGQRQSRFIAEAFGGDRRLAVKRCVGRVARILGPRRPSPRSAGERGAWEGLAPLLARIPDLARWSARDRRRLLRILRRKGSPAELGVDAMILDHEPLLRALRRL